MSKTHFFKIIGQKAPGGKMALVMIVPDDTFGPLPSNFEFQAIIPPPNIYTGIYPTIRINTDTMVDRTQEDKGVGWAGIMTGQNWQCSTEERPDQYGIELSEEDIQRAKAKK